MRLRLWPVMVLCLFPVIAQSGLPNAEELERLCQQSQREEKALLLLAELDETIRQWLQQPMDDKGNTPIHICAREGNLGLLLQLLLRGQPENLLVAANNYGDTPLHLAALYGHLPVVQYLQAHGASVTAANKEDETPLHWAVLNGQLPEVQYLLTHGALVTAVDQVGNTPLHWAAFNGQLPVVQCLLEHGAAVTAVNEQGNTPLDLATQCNHQPVIALLADPPEPDFTPDSLQSLASFALWREAGHIDRLRKWAQAGHLPPLQVVVLFSVLGFSQFQQK